MSFDFIHPVIDLGGTGSSSFQFYTKGFWIRPKASGPSFIDVILSGVSPITLTNAKADGLNYLKLFGSTEQNGTPTPDTPVDIWCNNGVIKVSPNLFTGQEDLTLDYYLDNNGVATASDGLAYTNGYTEVKGGTYTFSGFDYAIKRIAYFSAVCYDENKNVLGRVGRWQFLNNYSTFTTLPNTKYLRFNIPENTTSTSPLQLEEGSTATPYMPYGQTYTDGTTETVEVHSRNLFDVDNNLLEGYYINTSTGILTKSSDGSSSCFKDFLPSKPNVTYTMSRTVSSGTTYLRMWAYDKDKNPISLVFNQSSTATGTTPSGTAYIRCSFGSIPQYSQDIQLEIGSTATTYEPYYNGGTATAEMLLKVGTYKDTQEVLSGAITRNVGVKVLDGTEDWYEDSLTVVIRGATETWGAVAGAGGYCTHLTVLKSGEKIFAGACRFALDFNVYYYKDAFGVNSVTEFKNFLANQYTQGTPVIVAYPLATATTETVTAQPLSVQTGTNIVTITQASIDDLEMEVSFKQSL